MLYLFCYSRYETKCVIKFIFRLIFSYPPEQRSTVKKEGKTEIQKSEYLENKKSFLDEIKSIFHNNLSAIIW